MWLELSQIGSWGYAAAFGDVRNPKKKSLYNIPRNFHKGFTKIHLKGLNNKEKIRLNKVSSEVGK